MIDIFLRYRKIQISLFLFMLIHNFVYSQNSIKYTWWNPMQNSTPVLEGQGWHSGLESIYDRFPDKVKKVVREPVWNLSKHSAGLSLRFRSNAGNIKVRYLVINREYAMPHMPATGVSGLDLYAKNNEDSWIWFKGNYSFGDTIVYHFKNIIPKENNKDNHEYQLYLPLYNAVRWLEIGVPEGTSFEVLPLCQKKPVVVYGTSIAQGGCASRPGMVWTSILGRDLGLPVINMGFSGNGLLEKEVLDLITEIDAEIYILDCLPNLTLNKNRTSKEVEQRILSSVKDIRKKHSKTPILLVDHAGYGDAMSNINRFKKYKELNRLNHRAYDLLRSLGETNLYLLSNAELGLDQNSFVDGTHPTDYGMIQYAQAYSKIIHKIISNNTGK